MGVIRYKNPSMLGGFHGRRLLRRLKSLDQLLNVSVDGDGDAVTLSQLQVKTCSGIYCMLDEIGLKAHHP